MKSFAGFSSRLIGNFLVSETKDSISLSRLKLVLAGLLQDAVNAALSASKATHKNTAPLARNGLYGTILNKNSFKN